MAKDKVEETMPSYNNSSPKDENIIKNACKELEINIIELSEKIGASEGTVRNWTSSNKVPLWALKSIELLKENKKNQKISALLKELFSLIMK